jgi:hypothetical protein
VQKYNFFCFSQEKFKVFFEDLNPQFLYVFLPVYQRTLHVLRGAKVISKIKSHKLFLIYFQKWFLILNPLITCQSFNELIRCCGCKSSTFIHYFKLFFWLFFNVFPTQALTRWKYAFWKRKFFPLPGPLRRKGGLCGPGLWGLLANTAFLLWLRHVATGLPTFLFTRYKGSAEMSLYSKTSNCSFFNCVFHF